MVYKFSSTYEEADPTDPNSQWEYGTQSELCAINTAEWGDWGRV